MLANLLLSFVIVNFTADLGGTNEYPHLQRVFFQTAWSETYFDDDTEYTYQLNCNFNVTLALEYNDNSEKLLTYESFELDYYVYVYGSDLTLINNYHYDLFINSSKISSSFTSIEDFKLVPANYYGTYYAYELYYQNNYVGRYILTNFKADLSRMYEIHFYGENFSRSLTFVMNTVTISNTYTNGYNDGFDNGYKQGNSDGYNDGYTSGYNEGSTQDATAVAIFSGIISVGLIPINFFLACLNFEVFGINIGAFVSALLTVAIVVIITRMIISGGNGGDK